MPDAGKRIHTCLTITGTIILLLLITAVWSIPRTVSDLYISLAAGRDVLAGKLNTPDDWSFSTNGKVWINQNWGADVILYAAQTLGGETGLLAIKFLLLTLTGLFLILALRQLEIPLPPCLLTAALCIAAINVYTILRPNLFTLTLLPLELWLLYQSRMRTWIVWLAVLVVLYWANLHGGFLFGLGMLWLHAACTLLPALFKEKGKALKQHWQLPAAAVAALLLAALANPFGFRNLTLSLLMAQGGVWNVMRDWQPLWKTGLLGSFMAGITGFLAVLGITILLLILRLMHLLVAGKPENRPRAAYSAGGRGIEFFTGNLIFDIVLALVSIVMAVLSNRFLAIALLAMAPILARQLSWLVKTFRPGWPATTGGFCLVLIFAILLIYDNARTYDPRNPLQNTGKGTFFKRMHYTNITYDAELVRFINANNISGPVFSPWQWEGYLRWNAPHMQPFIGGRAQQVYSTEAFTRYLLVSGGTESSYDLEAAGNTLNSLGAHYLITYNSATCYNLIYAALTGNNWVIVYADTRCLLFANTSVPAAAKIAGQLRDGQLTFETEAARTMSRAAYILSQPARWEADNLAALFQAAYAREPRWLWSYMMLFTHTQGSEELFGHITTLMEEQLLRLESMPLDNADAGMILECRTYIAESLANLAGHMNRPDIKEKMIQSQLSARQLWSGILGRWKPLIIAN
ncbi:MAG: hypothetical protein JW882_20895 [Deltaproteobacteria bacterium]|nr:hypothetical protein [Deltaproteobacteria bacterium]